MRRVILSVLLILSIVLFTNFSKDFFKNSESIQLIEKEKPKKMIIKDATVILYPEIADTARSYIRGIAYAFQGRTIKDSPDTMIISVLQDSLDRAFYFLDKLGKVDKKKVNKVNETKYYYETKDVLMPLLEKRRVYTKELQVAEEHPDAVIAENKILAINDTINPLLREVKRIEFGTKYTYIVICLKQPE